MSAGRIEPEVERWLKATSQSPYGTNEGVGRVMARVRQVRQRGRWWPLARRRSTRPATTRTTDDQPMPILAANGHSPSVIGRTQTMLSPVTAIAAGALAFAIGGAVLIAQPFRQEGSVPGAESEALAPTWVTGTVEPAPSCSAGETTLDGDVYRYRNVECGPQTWTSTDPRLTGEVTRRWNDDAYPTDEGTITVSRDLASLRNDEGGWACSASDLVRGYGSTTEEMTATTYTCVGDGGYDGLSALLVSEQPPGSYSEEFVGLIFAGEFPPLPEPPAAE